MPSHRSTEDIRRASPPALLLPSRAPRATVTVGLAAVVLVAAFGLLISKTGWMTRADLRGVEALNALHTGLLGALGAVVYRIFSPVEAVALTVVIVAVLWVVTKDLRVAATFAVTVAVTWLSSDVIKTLVHRARPDHAVIANPLGIVPADASFPSGHMVFVATLAVSFLLLARRSMHRGTVTVVGAVVVVVVAFSLVADGVHYPSDVISSIVWSLGVTPLVLHLSNRYVLPRAFPSRVVSARERTAA